MNGVRSLILLSLMFSACSLYAAERTEVSLAGFLKSYAGENNIEIQGLEIVGGDTFTPPAQPKSVDKTLRRALSRFNTIETYGDQGIVRVVILGRKGSSVGALPEDAAPIEPSPAETESQPES